VLLNESEEHESAAGCQRPAAGCFPIKYHGRSFPF
jgi:hypothetical protein